MHGLAHKWNYKEDCLFLNVFTPNPKTCNCSTDRIPVMIYIHGGGFVAGNYSDHFHTPDNLLNKCVIVVSFNYRLHIFGFLSLRLEQYSGNMGLKDQKLAIKWVKENIESFGGDSNRITLFGTSAGSASVGFQTLNKESKKNFNQIIAMSGSPLDYFALMETFNHTDFVLDVIRRNGENISEQNELAEFLRNVDSRKLFEFFVPYDPTTKSPSQITLYSLWAPIVERLY